MPRSKNWSNCRSLRGKKNIVCNLQNCILYKKSSAFPVLMVITKMRQKMLQAWSAKRSRKNYISSRKSREETTDIPLLVHFHHICAVTDGLSRLSKRSRKQLKKGVRTGLVFYDLFLYFMHSHNKRSEITSFFPQTSTCFGKQRGTDER